MHWVRPKVFCIGQTMSLFPYQQGWLKELGAPDYDLGALHRDTTQPESLVTLAARRCYKAFGAGVNPNVTRTRDDGLAYLQNILEQGHGSVLEHATFSFAIENVSRVFTGEMNRHRAGMAISEASMRYIRYDDIPMVEVPSLRLDEPDLDAEEEIERSLLRNQIMQACGYAELYYRQMNLALKLDEHRFDYKKRMTSLMRRIIPMGVATGGVWTGNIRAWRHIIELRTSDAAEEEIREVAGLILDELKLKAPFLFGDFIDDRCGHYTPKYSKV